MIYDNLKNCEKYYSQHPLLKEAFKKFLICADLECDNTVEISYHRQSYITHSDTQFFEAHRKYIDIQIVTEGIERIYVSPLSGLSESSLYDEINDTEFFNYNPGCRYYDIQAGDFLILFPGEAHCPCISAKEASDIRKTVIKVLF